ncbi:hypothetical protein FRC16_008526 [Serendipita sp. 398]|nr:hypothetical protein FRC16_008526 [Serendipita sp. 398]
MRARRAKRQKKVQSEFKEETEKAIEELVRTSYDVPEPPLITPKASGYSVEIPKAFGRHV